MDILGFIKQSEEAFKNGTSKLLLQKLYTAMDGVDIHFGHFKDKYKIVSVIEDDAIILERTKYKIFTDNIIIGIPFTNIKNDFNRLILSIRLFQFELVLQGIFIRGGLSLGQLHLGDNIVFGNALLESYNLENNISKNPRIVISQNLLKEIKNKEINLFDYNESSILIDNDGQYFINYLALSDNPTDLKYLNKHKSQIEEKLHEYKEIPEIWQKYIWVANYHNWYCQLKRFNDIYKIKPELFKIKPIQIFL